MKLAMLGDLALIGKWSVQNERWQEDLLELKHILAEYDYVIANLESALTTKNRSWVAKSMHLRSNPDNVEILKFLGISAVSLANNHILDFGKSGLQETIAVLDQAGIAWYGINGKCLHIHNQNDRVCISGFCCYSTNLISKIGSYRINLLSPASVMKQLQVDNRNDEYSIVSMHWGIEHIHAPSCDHIKLANQMLEFKPCSIHGHHPHVLQGIQKKQNGIVAYSLGNCLFDDAVSLNQKVVVKQYAENKETLLVGLDFKNSHVQEYMYIGLSDAEVGIRKDDAIIGKVESYSNELIDIYNIEEYERARKEKFNRSIQAKFHKESKWKWLISRMTYYAIGAKLLTVKNRHLYKAYFK